MAKKRNYLTSIPRATTLANSLLMKNYKRMHRAKQEAKPIVWTDINFPSFYLWAMGVIPIFPQVHSAFQAQRKKVKNMMKELESKYEIPHSICGEVKGLIGTAIYKNETAFELPPADILLTANTSCGIVCKGFRYLAEVLDKDLVFIDFPFSYNGVEAETIEYSTANLINGIRELEAKTGCRLTEEKAHKTTEDILLLYKFWEEICLLNTRHPSPVDSLDLFLFVSIMSSLPCDDDLFNLFIVLYNEIYGQIKKNEQSEHPEKHRILWHYLPIYSQKKFFKEFFDQNGISVTTASFFPLPEDWYQGWNYDFKYPVTRRQLDEARENIRKSGVLNLNFEEIMHMMAESLLEMDVNSNLDKKYNIIKRLIKNYDINGVIMHCDRSCRAQSLPQQKLKEYITNDLGVPVLLFDADSMDDRFFSASQLTTRMEAFIEMLNMKKN